MTELKNTVCTIAELQSIISEQIELEIDRLTKTEPGNLYQPIAYTLSMGGKRLRPVMVLLGCSIHGGDLWKALPAALAIEIFHNFTLLHDDMMDQADMRRNALTVHKKYNHNIAILSGDAMSIMAHDYLLQCDSVNQTDLFRLFNKTALEVCEGQQYDMDFEKRMNVSISEYLNMIRLKTAVLLACSLKMGALAANAHPRIADLLYVFGINLGIAFQLQDDLLDVFAEQKKLGKMIGGDIVSNKKTFLLLKALELADESSKKELVDWIEKTNFNPAEKIAAIKNIYNKLNIKEITEKCIKDFYDSAIDVWDEIELPDSSKNELLVLAKIIMGRDH